LTEKNYRFKSNNSNNENSISESYPDNLENIILETIKNNPKNTKAMIPVLIKIVTKNGLLCDFPFIYKNEEYHDKCAIFPDNKFYCKINSDNPQNILANRNSNKIQEFLNNFLDEKSKIKIHKTSEGTFYYDECLSLDETQRYLNDIVEENVDFKHKILVDLYSDVNNVIKKTQQEKLSLLYQLMDNYCKNKKFDFDCIYDNLILPISKSNDLNALSGQILDIFKNYQNKLKQFLDKSIKKKFKLEEYEFIKEDNLKQSNSDKTEESFSSIFEDEDKNTISLSLINSKVSSSKITIKHFFKILASIYNICIEDCKMAVDYLFVDNFENDFERIKLEIMAYLFKLMNFSLKDRKQKYNNTEVDELIDNVLSEGGEQKVKADESYFDVERNILRKIFVNSTHVNFIDEAYPILYDSSKNATENFNLNNRNNNQNIYKSRLLEFLNYRKWSVRFTIHIIFRYLIVEKSFFRDYITNHLTDFKLNKLLLKPGELIDKNQIIRLVKAIPLIMPYYSFSKKMHEQQTKIYEKWNNITDGYLVPLMDANETISQYKEILSFISSDILERLDIIDRKNTHIKSFYLNQKEKLDTLHKKLKLTKGADSIEKTITLKSYLNNLEYLTNNIFHINYFSQDCHKFIHYNTYFGNYTFGKPIVHYASIGYEPYFFIDFESDIQVYFIYSFLKFNTKISRNYTISIKTNSIIDLYLDEKKVYPDNVQNVKGDGYFDCLVQYNYTYVSFPNENSYVEMKIKGNFRQGTYLIDAKNFYFGCQKMRYKNFNKFLDFNITKKPISEENNHVKSFSDNYNNNYAYDKCKEHQFEVSLCFNYNTYYVDCEIATKYLSERFKTELKDNLYIIDSEKILNRKHFIFQSDEYKEYIQIQSEKKKQKFNPNADNNSSDKSKNSKDNKKNKKASAEEDSQSSFSELFNDAKFIKKWDCFL